jgi:GT2 family glycosyltransferase
MMTLDRGEIDPVESQTIGRGVAARQGESYDPYVPAEQLAAAVAGRRPPPQSSQRPLTERVTFGITAFERPQHLVKLVDSVLRYYPSARIIVADNGHEKAALPPQVEVLNLPHDCGLSAARNALIDRLETEFLLILEEDFEVLDETRIERFIAVLDHDDEIGFVGGSLYQDGRKLEYAVDMYRFRETFCMEPSRRDVRITPGGEIYRPCDMCFNFGLIRREMLREHRWPEELKLAEHWAYFEAVKRGARWRVAHCDQVRARHDRSGRSETYLRYRSRAAAMHRDALRMHGLARVWSHAVLADGIAEQGDGAKPNVVVLGVGHSGTSIVAEMLFAVGWRRGDADQEYGECTAVREINLQYLATGRFADDAAFRALPADAPWAVKDPRFVQTLHLWLPCFAKLERPPTLVWIRRDAQAVERSYLRRGELTAQSAAKFVAMQYARARRQFAAWPWGKVSLDYEQLAAAVRLFDVGRSAAMEGIFNDWRQKSP